MDEDPVETRMREEGRKAVSVERFSTEMFERLLGFAGEEVKQPEGSLLDLVVVGLFVNVDSVAKLGILQDDLEFFHVRSWVVVERSAVMWD